MKANERRGEGEQKNGYFDMSAALPVAAGCDDVAFGVALAAELVAAFAADVSLAAVASAVGGTTFAPETLLPCNCDFSAAVNFSRMSLRVNWCHQFAIAKHHTIANTHSHAQCNRSNGERKKEYTRTRVDTQ